MFKTNELQAWTGLYSSPITDTVMPMFARIAVLISACFFVVPASAQNAHDADDSTTTAADPVNHAYNSPLDIEEESPCGRAWIGGGRNSGGSYVRVGPCTIGRLIDILSGDKGREGIHRQDIALLEQIEQGRNLLEQLYTYNETLAAEVEEIKASRQSILQRREIGTVPGREITDHNQHVDQVADDSEAQLSSVESTIVTLLDMEQNLDQFERATRDALLEASTEIIVALEEARRELADMSGVVQGATIYR